MSTPTPLRGVFLVEKQGFHDKRCGAGASVTKVVNGNCGFRHQLVPSDLVDNLRLSPIAFQVFVHPVGSVMFQEKKAATEIVAVSVGPKAAADTIRTALAMGADRGVHIKTDESIRTDQGLEPLAIAKILKKVRERTRASHSAVAICCLLCLVGCSPISCMNVS